MNAIALKGVERRLGDFVLGPIVERLRAIGADPAPSTPAEFAQFIRREIDKWARVTAQSGFKAN